MNLQSLAVSLLNPAPYNPRIQLQPGDAGWRKLERSLEEFDLVQPIVWNERTGHVVAGHQRLQILKHRGAEVIDCVVVDLPLEQEKALNVTLNNGSVASDWDAEKLIDLVTELQELPDFDATLTGFDEQQLRDLVLAPLGGFEQLPVSEDGGSASIQVTLDVPCESWQLVKDELDQLLADHADVRLHIRNSPPGSSR